jgi:beta-glucosidase
VSFTVTNTGHRAGAEIAELYVAEKCPKVPRPVKELKGFSRVQLNPGESRTVTLDLNSRAFSYYDVNSHQWVRGSRDFEVLVGGSSQDTPLRGALAFPN